MDIINLTKEIVVYDFDCGDEDLNDFLINEAMAYQEKGIANTFVLVDGKEIIAYFSLLNDKISQTDVSKSQWRKLKKLFAHSKHRSNYPAIKIGRLAVSKNHISKGYGTSLMTTIKTLAKNNSSFSAFRFLTVDAYLSAIPFYLNNGFIEMLPESENSHTHIMYFDMLSIRS